VATAYCLFISRKRKVRNRNTTYRKERECFPLFRLGVCGTLYVLLIRWWQQDSENIHTSFQIIPSLLEETSTHNQSAVLLDIRFYVYENLLMLDANGTKVGNRTIDDWMRYRSTVQGRQLTDFDQRMLMKHTDDYWCVHSILQHPMRTFDPEEAKLFYVPTLINEITDQYVYQLADRKISFPNKATNLKKAHVMFDMEIIEWANGVLGRSPWFQRHQGRDHVLVASHWRTHKFLYQYRNFYNCNVIGFERRPVNSRSRIFLASTYVGHSCPRVCGNRNCKNQTEGEAIGTTALARAIFRQKKHNFSVVATMKPKYTIRNNVCNWLKEKNKFSTLSCGIGPMCPVIAQAKFGPHVPGDTPGANRLIDIILSATVPIFVTEKQFGVLPPFVDWQHLSFFANGTDRAKFEQQIQLISQIDDNSYLTKLQLILEHQELLDWASNRSHNVLMDTYMYAFARILFPDLQRQVRSYPHYSALRLERIEALRKNNHYAPSSNSFIHN